MPIRIPDRLPAVTTLKGENIFVMTEHRAIHQDIRPLNLVILNLMPTKITTETQLLRKLSNTPLQINVDLLHVASHTARNISEAHLESFYRTFDEIKEKRYDGMIITGAPVENMEFEDVDYWDELSYIMEWTKHNVHCTLHICWGAQAALYFHYGLQKRRLEKKLFGIYEHTVLKRRSPFFRGFDDIFYAPHSRWTDISREQIESVPHLEMMAVSEEAGVFAAKTTDSRQFFVMGHPEYDPDTLLQEYERDKAAGGDIQIPAHYFPGDDPTRPPIVRWRSAAQLLYSNWLNYYVYQTTPYDLKTLDIPGQNQ